MLHLSQSLLLVLINDVWQPSALLQDRRKAASKFRDQEDTSPTSCQIERMDASGLNLKSFAKKVANRKKPLLLYKVDNWRKLISNISEEILLTQYGNRLVPVESVANRNDSSFKLGRGMQSFRSYVLRGDGSSNSDIVFDAGLSTNFSRSVWREKAGHVPKFLQGFKALPVVSVGTLGTGAGMHRHKEAWLLALHGRKAWWIGEDDAGENNFYGTLSPCQYIGMELPPRYSFCVQHPGEIIYLPNSSWHATCNVDDLVLGIGAQGKTGDWPPLMKYVSNRDLSSLEKMLEGSSPENVMDSSALATALDHALALGYDDVSQRLSAHYTNVMIEAEPPLDKHIPTSLLHVAARAENVTLTKKFLDGGYSAHELFNAYNNDTAFDRSAECGNLQLVQVLGEAKTPLSLSWNRKAAQMAAESGHIEILKELKSYGIDVRAPGANGQRPIHGAAAGGHVPVAMALMGKGRLHIEARDGDGNAPMHAAAEQGHVSMLQFLLDHGAHISVRNSQSLQPLHFAAQEGHTPAVSYLIEQRADVMARGHNRITALHLCASVGHADVVDLLIERGAEVDAARGDEQMVPLQDAAVSGASSVAKILIKGRADVSATVPQGGGASALNLAAAAGHRMFVEILLANAEAALKSTFADEANFVAAQHGHERVLDFFKSTFAPATDMASEL